MNASHIIAATAVLLLALVLLIGWAENSHNPVWDFLRPLDSAASSLRLLTTALVFVLAAVMLFVSAKAYQKKPTAKFLFLVLAFAIVLSKFALKLIDFFYSPGDFLSHASQNVFDLVMLGALFLAVVSKD